MDEDGQVAGAYMRGWRDGAIGKQPRAQLTRHEDRQVAALYEAGRRAGRDAFHAAQRLSREGVAAVLGEGVPK